MTAADWAKRREQVEFALSFLASWWREALILGVLLFGIIGWHQHNVAERALGALTERMRVADSTIKATKPLVTVYDTKIVHDTVKLNRIITKLNSIRDTMRIHDTVWVKQFIASADSLKASCTELSRDCDVFRRNATAVIGAQDTKIRALEAMKRSRPCGLDWTLGPAIARTTDGWRVAPFSIAAGIGCRF